MKKKFIFLINIFFVSFFLKAQEADMLTLLTPEIQQTLEEEMASLVQLQQEGGYWRADVGFKLNNTFETVFANKPHLGATALVSLALLEMEPYLKAKQLPTYKECLEKALQFVLSCETDSGYFTKHGTRMLSHAFATQFLAKYYLKYPKPEVRKALAIATNFIAKTQNEKDGSWFYAPFNLSNNIYVSKYQLEALYYASFIDEFVHLSTHRNALRYFLSLQNKSSKEFQFFYNLENPSFYNASTSGIGLASLGFANRFDKSLFWSFEEKFTSSSFFKNKAIFKESHDFYFFDGLFSTVQAIALWQNENRDLWLEWNQEILKVLIPLKPSNQAQGNLFNHGRGNLFIRALLLRTFASFFFSLPEKEIIFPVELQAFAPFELQEQAKKWILEKNWEQAQQIVKYLWKHYPNEPALKSEDFFVGTSVFCQELLKQFPSEWQFSLKNEIETSPVSDEEVFSENWPTAYGNFQRNRSISENISFSTYKEVSFSIPTFVKTPSSVFTNDPREESHNRNGSFFSKMYFGQSYPVLFQQKLFIHGGNQIIAYSCQEEKKQLWMHELIEEKHFSLMEQNNANKRAHILSLTVTKDALYASAIMPQKPFQEKRNWQNFRVSSWLPRERLICFNPENGSIRWICPNPELSVITSPVVVGNVLYVGAVEFQGVFTCSIVALDANTGEVLWKIPVYSGAQESTFFGYLNRGVVGSELTYAEGNLYFVTNLGVIASVSIQGKLRWVRLYRQTLLDSFGNSFLTPQRKMLWNNHPAIFFQGKLIVTPLDSKDLICLEAESGAMLWQDMLDKRSPFPSVPYSVAGIYGEDLVICSLEGRKLFLVPLSASKPLERTKIIMPQNKKNQIVLFSGTGVICGNFFYAPAGKNLVKVNLKGGETEEFLLPLTNKEDIAKAVFVLGQKLVVLTQEKLIFCE